MPFRHLDAQSLVPGPHGHRVFLWYKAGKVADPLCLLLRPHPDPNSHQAPKQLRYVPCHRHLLPGPCCQQQCNLPSLIYRVHNEQLLLGAEQAWER